MGRKGPLARRGQRNPKWGRRARGGGRETHSPVTDQKQPKQPKTLLFKNFYKKFSLKILAARCTKLRRKQATPKNGFFPSHLKTPENTKLSAHDTVTPARRVFLSYENTPKTHEQAAHEPVWTVFRPPYAFALRGLFLYIGNISLYTSTYIYIILS